MDCDEVPQVQRKDWSGQEWWLQAPPDGRWLFRMVMAPSSFRKDEFALWKRYQQVVHKDPPWKTGKGSYQGFLVDHPFPKREQVQPMPVEEGMTAVGGLPRCGYGAFHVQFWIGEHLVAVSVVDVLPRCACAFPHSLYAPLLPN
jgi:arginyl-tRNA--protein-N-Asp/Glu arginylyltransferase